MAIKIIVLATIVALAAAKSHENHKMLQEKTDHHLYIPHDYYAYPKYSFDYGVKDFKTGDYKMHKEERDGDAVKGEYSVADPDGTIRTVTYTVTKHGGFQAVVEKSGGTDHHEYKAEGGKAPVVQGIMQNGGRTEEYKYGHANSGYQQSYQDVMEQKMEEKKVVDMNKKNRDAYKNHKVKQNGGQSEERSAQYKYGHANSEYQQSYQDVMKQKMEEKNVVDMIKKNMDAYKNHEVKQIGGQTEERSSQYKYVHANSGYQQRYQDVMEQKMEEKKVVDMIKKNIDAYNTHKVKQIASQTEERSFQDKYENVNSRYQQSYQDNMEQKMEEKEVADMIKKNMDTYKNYEEMSSYKYKYPITKTVVKQQEKEKVPVVQEVKKYVPQYKSDNYQIHTGGQYHGYKAVDEKMKHKKMMKPMKHTMMDVAMEVGKEFAPEVKEYVSQYTADNYQIHTGGQYHGYKAVDENTKQEKMVKAMKQEKMMKPIKHKMMDVAMDVGKDSVPEIKEYVPQYKADNYLIHTGGQYHGYKAVVENTKQEKMVMAMKQEKMMKPIKHKMMDVAIDVGKDSVPEIKEYVPQYKADNYLIHTGGQYNGYKAVVENAKQEKMKAMKQEKMVKPIKHKMVDVAMEVGKDSVPEVKEYFPQYRSANYQVHEGRQNHGYKAVDEMMKQEKIMKPTKQEKMKTMKHNMDVGLEVGKDSTPEVKEYIPQYRSGNYQVHTGGHYHGYKAVDEKIKQEKMMKHKTMDVAMEVEKDYEQKHHYIPDYYHKYQGDY